MSALLAYLPDTNILSDLVHNPQGVAAAQVTKASEDPVCTSIIVAAELHYGAIKSNFVKLSDRIDDPLGTGNPATGNTIERSVRSSTLLPHTGGNIYRTNHHKSKT